MAENTERIIIDVTVEGLDESKKNLQALKDETALLSQETKELQAELKKLAETQGKEADAYKKTAAQIEQNQVKIRQNQRAQLELGIAIRNATEAQKKATAAGLVEEGSLNALRKKLSDVTKERNAINRTTKEGAKRYAELTEAGKKLSDELKKEEKAIGDTRRNVGNYADALKEVIGDQTGFIGSIQALTYQMGALRNAVNTMTGSLKGIEGAIIGTGIGALIVLLGTLVAAFASTEAGEATLKSTIEGLKVAFKSVLKSADEMRKVAGAAIDNFIARSIDGFEKLGNAVSSALEFDIAGAKHNLDLANEAVAKSVTDIGDAIGELNDIDKGVFEKAKEAFDVTAAAEKHIIALKKVQIQLEINNLKEEARIVRLKKTADDVNLTEAKRLEAIRDYQKEIVTTRSIEIANLQAQLVEVEKINKQKEVSAEGLQRELELRQAITTKEINLQGEVQEAIDKVSNIQQEALNKRLSAITTLTAAEIKLAQSSEKLAKQGELNKLEAINAVLESEELTDERRKELLYAAYILEYDLTKSSSDLIIKTNKKIVEQEEKKQKELIDAREAGTLVSDEAIKAAVENEQVARNEIFTQEEKLQKDLALLRDKYQKIEIAQVKKTAKAEGDIIDAKYEGYAMAASDAFGMLAQLSAKNFKLQKAFLIAESVSTGIAGFIKALNKWEIYPLNLVLAATSAASTAIQVAKLLRVEPGSVGDVSASGGVSLPSTETNSRISSATLATTANAGNLQANNISGAISNIPAPIVAVADINSAQNRVSLKNKTASL